MTGPTAFRSQSRVARLVVRRARLASAGVVVLALIALLVAPGPPAYGAAWLSSVPDRFDALPPDILAGCAFLLALITLGASIPLRGAGLVRCLSVLLLGETVVATLRATQGVTSGACVFDSCPTLVGHVGSAVVVWVLVALVVVATWVATASFYSARRNR